MKTVALYFYLILGQVKVLKRNKLQNGPLFIGKKAYMLLIFRKEVNGGTYLTLR